MLGPLKKLKAKIFDFFLPDFAFTSLPSCRVVTPTTKIQVLQLKSICITDKTY